MNELILNTTHSIITVEYVTKKLTKNITKKLNPKIVKPRNILIIK